MVRVICWTVFFLSMAGLAFGNSPPEVSNVIGFQRPHTALIDVTFDISDADGDAVHVSLWYSLDGGVSWGQECVTVSGDVGPGVVPSTGLSATWDAGVDFPDFINSEFAIRVYADDGFVEECSISVTRPRGGEFWFTGDDISIRWVTTIGDNVKIELFKGGNLAGTISASTPNNGYYPWLNCTTFGLESGEDYSVRVTHLQDTNCSSQSELFELIDVTNCFIEFPWSPPDTIPDLEAGNVFNITWVSGNTSGTVDLELWHEPFGLGTLVGVIAQDLVDSGSYLWVVDSFNRGTDAGYRFRIRDAFTSGCDDRSIPFNMIDEVICSIDVLGVNEGQTYFQGQNIALTFSSMNASGIVDLYLYSGNIPVSGGLIVKDFDTQNGTVGYIWQVTDYDHSGPSFDRFNIRAFDAEDVYCGGQSPAFSIAQ